MALAQAVPGFKDAQSSTDPGDGISTVHHYRYLEVAGL